jgi:hypothetical protein
MNIADDADRARFRHVPDSEEVSPQPSTPAHGRKLTARLYVTTSCDMQKVSLRGKVRKLEH